MAMASSTSYLLFLLLLLPSFSLSQPPPPSMYNNFTGFGSKNFTSSTAVVIVVLLSAFFFLAFFSLYIRQCSLGSPSNAATARVIPETFPGRRRGGLDTDILETFPTFAYSEVKELKLGKEVLECAVCLSDFTDDETLRLLPACNHVFHGECIDVWLGAHVTCPVCRTNLSATPESANLNEGDTDTAMELVSISIDDNEVAEAPRRSTFGRSHTTGHSVSLPRQPAVDVEDRHTLRLPESVRREIVNSGKFRRASSCVGFAGGEASGRRGYRSMGARSERWGAGFFARAMSMRVPSWAGRRGEGEEMKKVDQGSFKKSGTFDCLGVGTSGNEDEESSTRAFARV